MQKKTKLIYNKLRDFSVTIPTRKAPWWLGLVLFFVSSASLSLTDDDLYLKITIKNNTPESCLLIHQQVFRGHISTLMPLPKKILSGTENTFFINEGIIGSTSISLTYTCGGLRSIKFSSSRRKSFSPFSTEDIITGKILSAVDMDAIFEVEHGSNLGGMLAGKNGSISWILS